MGFGNGAFQAARIAIDGVTIIQNIVTNKIQAVNLANPNVISSSTIPIFIQNNQNVATASPFPVYIEIQNIGQYENVASDLSNVYFSSDQAGQNKLYSWREIGTSATNSLVAYWVLLPNGLPANSNLTIYLQFATENAIDGVYTGVAPNLTPTYAQYDNGANVFTQYWNFSGTTLPTGFTSANSSDAPITINNGITFTSGTTDSPSYSYIVYNTAIPQNMIVEGLLGPQTTINTLGGINYDIGFSSSTTVGAPGEPGTNNQFSTYIGASIFQAANATNIALYNNSANAFSQIPFSSTPPFIFSSSANPIFSLVNYSSISSTQSYTSITYLIAGIASAGGGAGIPTSGYMQVYYIRVRPAPPNGIMPATALNVQPLASTNNSNIWTVPQIFNAITTFNAGTSGGADIGALYAYVANYQSNTVSVINTSTNTVVSTITVGSNPSLLAITPNGLYAYVANRISNNVSVINTSTNTVVATISVGKSPYAVAITPNGLYAYVTNMGSNNVSVINTSTNTVVSTISVGSYPNSIAITPNGLYAYVTNESSNTVSVINTSTNTVVATISTEAGPYAVAITPNGLYAYVANRGSNTVSVINTSTNTVVATITVGTSPEAVAITPNGLYAYVVNTGSNNVSVINTSTNTVVSTISVGTSPYAIAITPNGLYAYVTNSFSGNVSVINTSTNTVVATITVGTSPVGVAITPSQTLAIANNNLTSAIPLSQYNPQPQNKLSGTTAGNITYSMPFAGADYKKFIAYANGYENDTTTSQTITFPIEFTEPPVITTNTTGLTLSASTSTLTINAPNSTATYTGWIIVEGY